MTQQIQQQQTQQTQQMQQPGGNYDSRIGTLEYAVSNIATRLDSIANKLDVQGKVPWATIITAFLGAVGLIVTIVGAIGALAFSPLSAGIADVKAGIVKFESKAERFVPREDIDSRFDSLTKHINDRFQVGADRRNDLQVRTDDRIARVERDLEAVQKAVVPRGEHEQMWAAQRARDADLQRQSDQNRQGLYDLNTPRDTMQRLQQRLDELERERRRGPS